MKLSEVVFDFNETFGELMLIGEPKEVYVYGSYRLPGYFYKAVGKVRG